MAKKCKLAVLQPVATFQIDLRLVYQPIVRGIPVLFRRQGL